MSEGKLLPEMDSDRNARISAREFARGLRAVDIDLEPAQYALLFDAVDKDESKVVEVNEIMACFYPSSNKRRVRRESSKPTAAQLAQRKMAAETAATNAALATLHERLKAKNIGEDQLRRVVDADGNGVVTALEFRAGSVRR